MDEPTIQMPKPPRKSDGESKDNAESSPGINPDLQNDASEEVNGPPANIVSPSPGNDATIITRSPAEDAPSTNLPYPVSNMDDGPSDKDFTEIRFQNDEEPSEKTIVGSKSLLTGQENFSEVPPEDSQPVEEVDVPTDTFQSPVKSDSEATDSFSGFNSVPSISSTEPDFQQQQQEPTAPFPNIHESQPIENDLQVEIESESQIPQKITTPGAQIPVSAAIPIQPLLKPSTKSLVFQLPDKSQIKIPLSKDQLTIGRDPGNDIVLKHDTISKGHARLAFVDNGWTIEDLDSTNGVFIKGKRIPIYQPTPLPDNLAFSVGRDIRSNLFVPAAKKAAIRSSPVIIIAVLIGALFFLVGSGAVIAVIANNVAQNRLEIEKAVYPETAFQCQYPAMTVSGPAQSISLAPGTVLDSSLYLTPPPDGGTTSFITPPSPTQGLNYLPVGEGTPIVTFTPGPPTPTQLPSRPIISLAFLELPFPYDGGIVNFGGTRNDFMTASQRSASPGGRINSFFDHWYPLYPAPSDPNLPGGDEPAEHPIGGHILLYTGMNNAQINYTGHPAIDFSPVERRKSTTPLFAAADGIIAAVGIHNASGAYFVKINHFVPNVGGYQTIYWHLEPDFHFDAMIGREGERITAGTRVGTIGNTGWSTGHHLHFEVRFDRNNDGNFSNQETVDPYGWIPSVEHPVDPWYQRTGLTSHYLWIHPIGSQGTVNADGSGVLAQDDAGKGGAGLDDEPTEDANKETTLCAPPGSLPPGGTVFLSYAPDPNPSSDQAGSGVACVLSVLDASGTPVTSFNPAVQISLPINPDALSYLDPSSLKIYWQYPGSGEWEALDTTLDFQNGVATAYTNQPGHCALMGVPTQDIFPPETTFSAKGNLGLDDTYYENIEVTLSSNDPSGIEFIEYSLDGGSTWQIYTGPFTVEPNGLPNPIEKMDEEFFAGGPGRFLVLASTTDKAGNVEYPPALFQILIDPSKDPNPSPTSVTPTTTPTPTPTPSATPSPTSTPTPTIFACEYSITLNVNAFCRRGPGTVYDTVTGYTQNTVLEIIGQNTLAEPKWWLVQIPASSASCWVAGSTGSVPEGAACMPPIQAPPTPTPTFTPTSPPPTPGPPILVAPNNESEEYCDDIIFTWQPSTPESSATYEWVLERQSFATLAVGAWQVVASTITAETAYIQTSFECGSYHRWRVRAFNSANVPGLFSGYWYFTTYGD